MSFRYINPGYAELLDVAGGKTIQNDIYNPYSQVAFMQPSKLAGIVLPEMPVEIYMKCTVFLKYQAGKDNEFHLEAGNNNGIAVDYSSYTGWRYSLWANGSSQAGYGYTTLKDDALNEILLHIKAGDSGSGGWYYTNINGTEICNKAYTTSFKATSSTSVKPDIVEIYAKDYETTALSNIILSSDPIDMKEHAIVLPVKATETDMAANDDGSYTADKAGQYLLQTVDMDNLMKNFGGDTKITGLAFCGNPAYCTGTELTKLTNIQKVDGTVTELGSTILSTTATAIAHIAGSTDISLADLGKYQIGVKAGV